MKKKIVILGASSGIAQACAQLWAQEGHALHLVARKAEALGAIIADLKVRNPLLQISHDCKDLEDTQLHTEIFQNALQNLGELDLVFICYGTLGDEISAQENFLETLRIYNSNTLSQISLLTEASKSLIAHQNKQIAVVTSVAGDRGRYSNYTYGSAKAALSTYLSGLRAKLWHKGIHVCDIKPGFVKTPMTQHLKRDGFLWSDPEQVARLIHRAIIRKQDIAYVPGFWCWIMWIIRLIPGQFFKRLKL